ncbi:hypothetical protein [Phaeospirillum tilakii]|uniref:Uncharacterized protein n=1 Tax=Phaeospirillum tilakii TaxID=741673 RepID=A0ABW5CBZ7_9PROT
MPHPIDTTITVNVPGLYAGPALVIGILPIPYSQTVIAYRVIIPGHDEPTLVFPKEVVDDAHVVPLLPPAAIAATIERRA